MYVAELALLRGHLLARLPNLREELVAVLDGLFVGGVCLDHDVKVHRFAVLFLHVGVINCTFHMEKGADYTIFNL